MVLRDYQTEMLGRLNKVWRKHRSVMVQMPTGTGKTHLMAEVVRNYADDNVLIVAHRRELIEQIKETLAVFSIETGEKNGTVIVESIQKLSRHIDEISIKPKLVIIDEAHHALAKTYRLLWEKWPKVRFLGLTATPCRLNNAPFTDLFDVLLQSWSIQEFIDKGWLSDFEYVSASPHSEVLKQIRSLNKRGADGDYQTKEMATVMDRPESIEHLFKTYKQFADGKKGIVYAIDRHHAQHIADFYYMHGVRCAMIDSKTPEIERHRLVEEYRLQAIDVIVNVDIFSEGFDCPEVEFIQLARPTLSLSKYLQQVGRGMRVSEGKPHVLILDNVGLYQTFGLPTEERDWRQTFYGSASGKGMADTGRYVVLDENGQEKELMNLEMVRIKKGGKRGAGLEIFLKDGHYGIRNNGRISCPARFKEIVRLRDQSGYFAAGIYGAKLSGRYVEYASLIDRKGIDLNLKLFRDVVWRDGYFYSYYKSKNYQQGDGFWYVFWDPKGNCYYDKDPGFRMMAGVEVAYAEEHNSWKQTCRKLRYSTGNLSPRFFLSEMYYNRHIIIARDYLVVKHDRNHAYHICGFLDDTVIVQNDDRSIYLQIFLDGKMGEAYRTLPKNLIRISPISYIYYQKNLGLHGVG